MIPHRTRTLLGLLALACSMTACPPAPTPPMPAVDSGAADASDGTDMDAIAMDGTVADGNPADGVATACTADTDCADGVYCNGVERCMPGAAGADARGCVAATAPACAEGGACDEVHHTCGSTCPDADGDGHRDARCGGDDCDDADANRYPGNTEVCDARDHDEDCDCTTFGFRDADHDGYPDSHCCNVCTDGTRHCGTDCDDNNANVHPTAPEVCNGIDDNCNGLIDEGVQHTYYPDHDGDGFGDPHGTPVMGCTPPAGDVENNTDCNDTNAAIHPGAMEVCDVAMVDEDCDGTPNEGCGCSVDAPSLPCPGALGVCAAGTQPCVAGHLGTCTVLPTPERCNGLDDDCNGIVDDGVTVTCYADMDNDGYAPAGAAAVQRCPDQMRMTVGGCPANATNRAPTGVANIDCNDTPGAGTAIHPGAPEVCDGVDNNCNGLVDEGVTITCYRDGDNDGYAPAGAAAMTVCPTAGRETEGGCGLGTTSRAPAATTPNTTVDCDDTRADVNPAAPEICDAAMVDENCNGVANEGCTCAGTAMRPCPLPGACAAGNETCGAGMWSACSIRPVPEVCDGVDNNCNGMTDEGLLVRCYVDADNDTYAPAGATFTDRCPVTGRPAVHGCPVGTTDQAPGAGTTDCVDTNPAIHPGATEVCNGVDDNCNGVIDETVSITCYLDADNDTYAPAGATPTRSCPAAGRDAVHGCPTGFTDRPPAGLAAIDCNDANPAVNPGAREICNAIDDNCNGVIDEGVQTAFYPDRDHDGFGDAHAAAALACSAPAGYVANNGDCNDASAAIHPGAMEVCDAAMVDEDCDGTPNEGCTCIDGTSAACCASRGTQTCAGGHLGACSVMPTPETCNGVDDNCNGTVDENNPGGGATCATGMPGVCNPGTTHCTAGALACVRNVNPSPEVCDLQDNDCNGTVDDGDPGGGAACATGLQGVCAAGVQHCVRGIVTCVETTQPSAEVCDGLDNNCNGSTDEGVQNTYYRDADGDGFGNAAVSTTACTQPAGYVANSQDCDDSNASVGLPTPLYVDADHDGYGTGALVNHCPGTGYASANGDCDDDPTDPEAPNAHPGQAGYFGTGYTPPCTRFPCIFGLSWDYNCDGTTTKAPAGSPTCGGFCTGLCCQVCSGGGFNYDPATARCGDTVSYVSCNCGRPCTTGASTFRALGCH